MSDRMYPLSFAQLMNRALEEYARRGTLFGVYDIYRHEGAKRLSIFGESIETPFGPAAGPHTQLSQNILAAYAAGARFFELKTVQVIDGEDLPVEKPCILAADEGYNVEWSTELRVEEAFDEYVRAWYALKLLSREFDLGAPDGFAFNMSVGYDLAGIQTEKIDRFIEGLKDASERPVWRECTAWARENLHRFRHIDAAYLDAIDARVCRSITLSTLHGCPAGEIERIAEYLLREKGLHTFVKCNPTLLGYDFVRKTLDGMGYDSIQFDDHHFRDDLQYEDALPMFRRLLARAAERGLTFGLKLTNTFPVRIARGELPGEEMYMSGKSLYPLTIALAARIERDFEGAMRVSYSGGADAFNVERIFLSGIWPITMATTLLKPGGYNRLAPMARRLSALPYAPFAGVDVRAVEALSASARADAHHVKPMGAMPTRRREGASPLIDCFLAPCADTCPIGQDVPAYLDLLGRGEAAEALRVICERNPLPNITGTLCTHRCQAACTRTFYEEPVNIRAAKLEAARRGMEEYLARLRPAAERKERVAVVGGGPAGMSAAFFLARAGAKVVLFEKRDALGGVVRHVIPAFRISDKAIERDAELLRRLGVEIRLNAPIGRPASLLEAGFTHVICAFGAWRPACLTLEKGEAMDALAFMETQKKRPEALRLGARVAVVGGGNTAMDAARAALRADGVREVTIVYRRTAREMPAEMEELECARSEGVRFRDLRAPVSLEDGGLLCRVMRLSGPDETGRARPVPTGQTEVIPADTVIAAIGEQVDEAMLRACGVEINARGRADRMRHDRLYVVGDALRGPATVVESIADAMRAAEDILGETLSHTPLRADPDALRVRRSAMRHCDDPATEKDRCLGCSALCGNCVDACPNRANVALRVEGLGGEQILHIDQLCNECGNCAAFCPYEGAPYKDKFTLFRTAAEFDASENQGFLPLADGRARVRYDGRVTELSMEDETALPREVRLLMRAARGLY